MPRPTLVIRNATIVATPVYMCRTCRTQAIGTSLVAIESVGVELPDLKGYPVSNYHMPFGWSGFGIDSHSCPDCLTHGT